MNLKETLGKTIKDRRNELGYSLDKMSILTGTDKGHLSKIENGKILINAETLLNIAKVLLVDVNYLYQNTEISNVSKSEEEILYIYKNLSQEKQNQLMVNAQYLLDK